jgi:hypothetical protein
MRAVTLERRTRQLVQRWTAGTTVAATAATALAVAAGGTTTWARWLLGLAAISGFVAACRFRTGLHIGALSGVTMIAVVPHDAVIDRGVVAAIGGLLLLVACESAHVARHLITVAPVQSTRRQAAALSRLTIAAALGVTTTAAFAQADRWGGRSLIVGLVVSGVAAVALIGDRSRSTT